MKIKFFDKIAHTDLLILDDFGQLVETGTGKTLIIVSQLWFPIIENELIAESCLNNIVHKAIRF